nr:EOG090X097L [Eulimnadia texana]
MVRIKESRGKNHGENLTNHGVNHGENLTARILHIMVRIMVRILQQESYSKNLVNHGVNHESRDKNHGENLTGRILQEESYGKNLTINVVSSAGEKPIATLKVEPSTKIGELKKQIQRLKPHLYPERQELRLEPRGKGIDESKAISAAGIKENGKLYLKDLGPQVAWKTVFLAEYAGPLLVYLWIYQRPWLFYGDASSSASSAPVVHIAAACWTIHYLKRILETIFVHRFSHATMPVRNLFRNCGYYWLFAGYVAYHVNHPLYTAPCQTQSYIALGAWTLCQLGNFSIHWALRNLRPPGSKERKIPRATGNPFTRLFDLVSCPNYTYEVGGWIAFTIMTQCLPAGLFTLAGFYQMAVWALGSIVLTRKTSPTTQEVANPSSPIFCKGVKSGANEELEQTAEESAQKMLTK